MPRPTIEAAIATPALPPALRDFEAMCVGVAGGEEMNTVEIGVAGGGEMDPVEVGVAGGGEIDPVEVGELVEDVDANTEDDVVELDATCIVKDCGGGA